MIPPVIQIKKTFPKRRFYILRGKKVVFQELVPKR